MRKNTKKYVPTTLRLLSLISLLLIFSLIITACGNVENEVVNDVVEDVVEEPTAVPIPIPDQSAYYAVPHNVYDSGKGPNDWCGRCHDPQNWNPEATLGRPPNCVSCKFEGRDWTVGDGNVHIEPADFIGIPCETCHEVDANGTASAEYAWLNPISMEYVDVKTPTELCEMCHYTLDDGHSSIRGTDHSYADSGSAHLIFGGFTDEVAPPQYCSDCHNPHDNHAIPSCEDCHDVRTLDTHILGKNAFHGKVTCMACHDSNGYDVGPTVDEEKKEGLWVTQLSTTSRGSTTTSDVISHSISWAVTCDKCHIEDSPYGLTEYTATGAVPMIDICVGGIEDLNIEKPTASDHGELGVDYTLGTCPVVDICVDGEMVEGVFVATLEEVYGTVDVDYTLDACPETDG